MDEQILPYDILRFDYKERLSDRFLATHLHRFEMFSKPVALVVLVEIINPWHPSSELGQKILNSLIREFLKSDAQSYLSRFEIALKQTNRAVQEALDQTKSPVSCVAVLLESDQIHCASIGTSKLGLLRNGKLATVLGSKNSYNETFSAVTSGDMKEKDWLFIANETFYSLLATVEHEIWLDDDIAEIGTRISQMNDTDPEVRSAGVILRYNLGSPSVNQTFLWGETSALIHSARSLKLPKVNLSTLTGLAGQLGNLAGRAWGALISLLSRSQRDSIAPSFATKSKLPKLSKRVLMISAFVVLLLVVWVVYRQSHKSKVADVPKTTLLSVLQSLPAEKLQSGLETKFTLSDYQSLSDDDKSQLSTLLKNQKATLVELPAVTIQAQSDIVDLEILDNQPLFIDVQGQTWLYNGSLLTQLPQKTPITNPVSLTAFSATNIVATDSSGNIWRLDGTRDQPHALTQAGALSSGNKIIDHYQNNLYLVNLTTKVTSRVSNFTADLNGESVYNKAENLVSITNPTDIAINGKVLLVDSNGLVVEFTRGTAAITKFQLPFVNGPVKIASSDKSPVTIIASGRTLYLVDNSNNLLGSMFLVTNAKIEDIALDPTNPNMFWVATGNQIYFLSIPNSP
ncbi:MAG: hypothetical protein NUV80_04740 [Candidatus Berkelbacteria bacterium]|nr:hypothetical protein [Candidatus Berkelbacteria bacterium]MCR4307847.1 hypothetical protein [Candidatus Berkelbacteria bacterium]